MIIPVVREGPARDAGGRVGHHCRRRGRIRRRGGRDGQAAPAGRGPDGPADAGRRRGRWPRPASWPTAPSTRVVVLTTYDTDADIVRAVEAGATGYLLKDTPRPDLVSAIRAAARGETVLGPAVACRLVSRLRRPAAEPLSARETEVLTLVARGQTNAEIGRALYISEATVKTHSAPRVRQARRLRPDGGRHQGDRAWDAPSARNDALAPRDRVQP